MIEVAFWTFVHHESFILFHLYKFMESQGADSFCLQSHQ